MNYFKLWCEWDYGQDYYIFTSEDAGKAWLANRIDENELKELEFNCVLDIFEEGLAGFEIVKLVTE